MTMVLQDSKTGTESVSAVLPSNAEAASFISAGHPMIGMWSAIKRLETYSLPDLNQKDDEVILTPGQKNREGLERN